MDLYSVLDNTTKKFIKTGRSYREEIGYEETNGG